MKVSSATLERLLELGILLYEPDTGSCRIPAVVESIGWETSLGFEHVAIKQKKNKCNSRLDVNTSSEVIKGVMRPIPLIAANMSTVCNADFCIQLYNLGALGVMHRAAYDEVLVKEIEKIAKSCEWVAGSIGVGESQLKLAGKLIEAGCNIIFIDIAHGYSDAVLNIGKDIKLKFPHVKVVIGNTTNTGLLLESLDFADAIKVGIAQGNACETKNTAGCTEKQFSAVLKFKELSNQYGMPIISDGGTREPADMVKALAAGANSVMAGSIFARCPESAAEVINLNGKDMKIYAGMACYSEDTEILTKNGWKLFADLKTNEEVATLNPENNTLEYCIPLKHYNYNYTGKMVYAKSTSIDLLVTPNHRMYLAKRHSIKGIGDFQFIEAENCIKNGTFVYKKSSGWKGDSPESFVIEGADYQISKSKNGNSFDRKQKDLHVPMKEWVDFFGFWLAEGSATKKQGHSERSSFYNERHFGYQISISNNNADLINHYKNMLVRWGLNPFVRVREKNSELTVNSLTLWKYLSKFGKAHQKFIPNYIKNLSTDLLEILLNSIHLGDGAKSKECIFNSSVQLIEDIYEIAIKLGRTPTIGLNHKKGSKGLIKGREFIRNHDVFSIYIGDYHKNPHLGAEHHSMVDYSGKVFCVEVPHGIVCVRRNKQYVWCGNSRYVQDRWKGGLKDGTCPEGGVRYLELGESAEKLLERWRGALMSGITYAGAKDIPSFQKDVEFVKLAS